MNSTINAKLIALRSAMLEATEGRLEEAAGATLPYAEYMMDADVAFLGEVAKLLKKEMGTKVDPKVHKGTSTVFMGLEGVNQSDMEVSLTVALHTVNWTDVKLNIWGEAGMRGNVEDERSFKSGVLTPKLATAAVMEFLR